MKAKIRTRTRSNIRPKIAKKSRKILGDKDAAGITSLVPGVKNSRLRNGVEFDWAY